MVLKQWYQSSLAYLISFDTNCTTSTATNLQVLWNPEHITYFTVLLLTIPFLISPPPCMNAQALWSCLTLCNPMDCSPPGSSVHGILQARILERVAMPSSRGSSPPRDQTHVSYVSCIGRWVLYSLSHLGSPSAPLRELHWQPGSEEGSSY